MKTNVMKQAWAIARTAAANFGGRAVEFFAEALREAWKLAKIVVPAMAGAMMVDVKSVITLEDVQKSQRGVYYDEKLRAFKFHFAYDKYMISQIKSFKNAKWSPDEKRWVVPAQYNPSVLPFIENRGFTATAQTIEAAEKNYHNEL
jgi:hypothetical protein